MDEKIVSKYLSGIIANRNNLDKSFLPYMMKFDDDRFNFIANAITNLFDNGSTLSDLIIIESIKNLFLEIGEIEQWNGPVSDWFESFVYTSMDSDIPIPEVEELYTILQRQRLSDQTKKILIGIIDKDNLNETDLDSAQEKLRLIKAVYPSKSAKLDSQTAEAVCDALDNSSSVIPYGINSIDKAIGGICKKEITIIAGRPGHGKTSIVCQFALNWIKDGQKVLFISKEMSITRLLHKFFSNIGSISANDIKMGAIDDRDYLNSVACSFVNKYKDHLFLYDNVYTVGEIEKLVLKHKPDVVIDDFIQLGTFEKSSRDLRSGILNTMKRYKEISKENNCAFVVLSQLNRSIEGRDDPTPRQSDLAESGSLEQLAGDVCFIYYEYKVTFNESLKNRVMFIISKARFGESTRINLGFDGNYMKYYSIPNFKGRG